MEALTNAYSNTYLNWPLDRKLDWVESLVTDYAIDGVICHANRSCRRALADITPASKATFQTEYSFRHYRVGYGQSRILLKRTGQNANRVLSGYLKGGITEYFNINSAIII